MERYRTLLGEAEKRLKALGAANVITRFGDGGEGWPEQAPFDRILVTAAADEGAPDASVAAKALRASWSRPSAGARCRC